VKDFISDNNNSSPDADVEKVEITEKILMILKTLKPKEGKVIQMRFGIGLDRSYTSEEIGREFMISRKRVGQIEANAFKEAQRFEEARGIEFFSSTPLENTTSVLVQ